MTSDPPEPHGQLDLSYLAVSGGLVRTHATVGEMADHVPASLIARSVRLADGTQARQLVVDQAQRPAGYQQLDNEILAGWWLYQLTRSRGYPAQVSRLIGFKANSADPFALLHDYRGEPAAAVASHLTPGEQHRFQVSLMTGLRWLTEAGIAHCAIGPDTVRWDGEQVQITDFSLATVIGTGRSALNRSSQQVHGLRAGPATDGDDVWAALLLSYYIDAGQEFTDPGQLADWPAGGDLAAEIAAGPENCQSAHAILTTRLGAADPVPLGMGSDPTLAEGIDEFFRIRASKHPGAPAVAEPPTPLEPPFPDPPPPRDDEPAATAGNDVALGRKGRLRPRMRR
jgi:hypothetical protein